MKNRILKLTVLGIGLLGILGIAYGASKTRSLNGNEYISEYSLESRANTSDNVQLISVEKAKSIALAQVPGANESHLGEIDLDREHGRMEYEIGVSELRYRRLQRACMCCFAGKRQQNSRL